MKHFKSRVTVQVLFLVVLVLVMVMVACQSKESSVNNPNKSEKAVQDSNKNFPKKLNDPNVIVQFWASGEDPINDFKDAIPIFEEKYGGKVTIWTAANVNENQTKLVAALSAGNPPDIVFTGRATIDAYVKNLVQPINDFIDFDDPIWDDVRHSNDRIMFNGIRYGVSRTLSPITMAFNQTLFENSGRKTPLEYYNEGNWNWETYAQEAKALTMDIDRDGIIDVYGTVLVNAGQADMLVVANDTNLVKKMPDGKYILDAESPNLMEALTFYHRINFIDKTTYSKGNGLDMFLAGKLAMYPVIKGNHSVFKEQMKDTWDFAPFPNGPSAKPGTTGGLVTGGFLAIMKGARNPEGAAALLCLRHKVYNELLREVEGQYWSQAQIERYAKMRRTCIVGGLEGTGTFFKEISKVYINVGKGAQPATALGQQLPVLQAEFEQMLSGLLNP